MQLSGLSNISLEIFSICSSTWRMISVLVSLTLTIIFGADLRSGMGRTGLIPDSCSILFFSCSESSTSYWKTCITKDFDFHFWSLKVIWCKYSDIISFVIWLWEKEGQIFLVFNGANFQEKLILIFKFIFSKIRKNHSIFFDLIYSKNFKIPNFFIILHNTKYPFSKFSNSLLEK